MLSKIHYAKPSITEREVAYAADAARNGWAEHCFDYIHKFRDLLKDYLGVPHVIPTSSCTGALHLGLAALGIGPGDEVILPDITWIASAAPVTYLGATPVFVDVLEDSWCIDPAAIEAAITSQTKAIIIVHIYGNLCDMDAIMAIGKKHGLPVIEDAAEALGSVYKGKKAGAIGDMATFSFHGTKTVTTGEGGALVVRSDALFDKISILESHGRDPRVPKQFWCEQIGYKYKMPNIAAAIGAAQMERIDELVARKREIFKEYVAQLGGIADLRFNPEPEGAYNSYWMSTVVFGKTIPFVREDLISDFKKGNIDARVFFYPLSMMPPFEKCPQNKISYGLYDRGMNLPSYHDLTKDDISRVCGVIKNYLAKSRNPS
ncbi:MAG: DegT/DnrJ/EryC1/StrS family aminotransferase [Alphaproteobacteria bacterium]|nr:DegT/DnrJ/EryC1/StrS family aminotransferase [Alphaproteobacteria bacterium]MDE2336748.1 DegT/DnrJ/EryC1/StrS family aminotransferase [Alphaproteobacteria bacterium]